jgi:hypothetical protein
LVSRLGAPDGALRASFGVGSTLDDADRLADAVTELVVSGTRWSYSDDSGAWAPTPDPRPRPSWAQPPASLPLLEDFWVSRRSDHFDEGCRHTG